MSKVITEGYNYLIDENLSIRITNNVKGSLKVFLHTLKMLYVSLLVHTNNI